MKKRKLKKIASINDSKIKKIQIYIQSSTSYRKRKEYHFKNKGLRTNWKKQINTESNKYCFIVVYNELHNKDSAKHIFCTNKNYKKVISKEDLSKCLYIKRYITTEIGVNPIIVYEKKKKDWSVIEDKRKKIKVNIQKMGKDYEGIVYKTELKLVKLIYFKNGRVHTVERWRKIRTPLISYIPNPSFEKLEVNKKGNVQHIPLKPSTHSLVNGTNKDKNFDRRLKALSKLYAKIDRENNKRLKKKRVKDPIKRRHIKSNKFKFSLLIYPKYLKKRKKI